MEPSALYEAHRATVKDILDEDMPAWDDLPFEAQSAWGEQSYHQTLRDRDISVTLRELQEGAGRGTRSQPE